MNWLANDMEHWVFQETLRMNERGLPIDRPLVDKTVKFLKRYARKRSRQCRRITGGIAPTQVGELQQWLASVNPKIKNLQRVTLERILKTEQLEPEIREVIRIRLEQGRVATKKLLKMQAMDSGDARMRGGFIYHGAGPGRFTAVGLQPHNFIRPTIKEVDEVIELLHEEKFDELEARYPGDDDNPVSVLEAVGSCMRGMFKAPVGQLLVRADYSAIEARVLAWLARQDDLTLMFHEGKDVYVDMAGDVFNEDPDEILAGHKIGDIEQSSKRKLGKDTILGCGYSMWIITFLCQMEAKGSDDIAGIPIRINGKNIGSREEKHFNPEAIDMAKTAVLGYRERYAKIKKYWRDIEETALRAVKNPRRKVFIKNRDFARGMHFVYDGSTLGMWLPSGRYIKYPKARVEKVNKFNKVRDQVVFEAVTDRGFPVEESLYGGKETENAVQGIARDIMVYGMWQGSKEGFKNIGTVHDEIITLHDYRNPHRLARRFEGIICRLPDWADSDDLINRVPLAAEGVAAERYGK